MRQSQQTHRLFSEWLSTIHTMVEKGGASGQRQNWAEQNAREVEPIPILQCSDDEARNHSKQSEHAENEITIPRKCG